MVVTLNYDMFCVKRIRNGSKRNLALNVILILIEQFYCIGLTLSLMSRSAHQDAVSGSLTPAI